MTDEEEFELSTQAIWAQLRPWLTEQFGEKCEEYQYGCECCERWKLAEQLLAYDRIGTPADLRREIEALRECLQWREELLAGLTDGDGNDGGEAAQGASDLRCRAGVSDDGESADPGVRDGG